MTDRDREDVDPADALGGPAALPLADGQPRGAVPVERDAPRTDVAPEASDQADDAADPDAGAD